MKFRRLIFGWLILGLIGHPLLFVFSQKAQAQTNSEIPKGADRIVQEDEGDWTEPEFDQAEIQNNQPLQELALTLDKLESRAKEYKNLFQMVDKARLIISEQDKEAIRQGRADERILQALVYLVTPKDQNGAGLKRLKIKRLVRGYATEKRALSKETEYENEEDINLSAHHTGQAADISEIDQIRFLRKTKKKALGLTVSSKSQELPPANIQVAWQSEKGKGEGLPGFYGQTANQLFENLSIGNMKEVLSDLIDYNLEELRGENLPEWTKWLGAIMLFEDFDLPFNGFEENRDFKGMLKEMGRATIADSLNIDKEAIQGESKDELLFNLGRSSLENKLGLEQGSLAGESLEEVLKNAGRKKLEKELKLSSGNLDGPGWRNKTKDESGRWKIYKTNEAKDAAFDLPQGSAEKIEAGDESGLALVGAGVLIYALAIENKDDLYKKIKNKEALDLDLKIGQADLRTEIEPKILKDIVSRDKNKRKQALANIGEKTLNEPLLHPDISTGLTKKEWEKIKTGKGKINDLVLLVGSRKLENELNLPQNSLYYTVQSGKLEEVLANIGRARIEEGGKKSDKFSKSEKETTGRQVLQQTVAPIINKEFNLSKKYKITDEELLNFINGNWTAVTQKIGGREMDKVLKLPENGTFDIVSGQKSAEDIIKESGAIRFGHLLGLSGQVHLEGNLTQNYGQTIVEENLGLKPGSFSGSLDEIEAKNGVDKIDAVFANPEEVDSIFGLKIGTTKDLLDEKISPTDYSQKTAKVAFSVISLEKVVDYFELGSWQNNQQKRQEIERAVKTLNNWATAGSEDKNAFFATAASIAGQSYDHKLNFEPGLFAKIIGQPNQAGELLLNQGMKMVNSTFGFSKDVITLRYKEGKKLSAEIDQAALKELEVSKIRDFTGIENDQDALNFLNGNLKDGFACWGISALAKEANQYLPAGSQITYQTARDAYFGNPELEQTKIGEALNKLPSNANSEEIEKTVQETKKQVRGQLRKELQYQVYDGLLRKEDSDLPVGFTKALFEGTPEEKSAVIGSYAVSLISGGKVSITPAQQRAWQDWVKDESPQNFQKLKEQALFGTVDNFLKDKKILGIPIVDGFSEALINSSKTGNYSQLGTLYKDWANNQVYGFFDDKFGLPEGTSQQVYTLYSGYKAGTITEADIATQAASLILGPAVQKSLAKIDDKLGLAPGTTQNLINYFARGDALNPAALPYLIMAVLSNVIKVKVEFYGEKPVCERASEEVIEWERISGNPQKDFPFYQRHARCSVKRMLGGLMALPEKTHDEEQKATQILTQRPEDVDYYAQKIYELYGRTKLERGWQGLMSSDKFWQYIHIGY